MYLFTFFPKKCRKNSTSFPLLLKNPHQSHRSRDVPECVFEFRSEPDRNSISTSGRNRTGTLIVLSYIYVTCFLLCIDCFICDFSEIINSERLFSEFGNIFEEKRSRLLPETGEKLLFLHHNLKLF